MTRVGGLLLLSIAACNSSKPSDSQVDPRAADGFAHALEGLAAADPTQSAALLAEGAYRTVARSEKCLEQFGAAATEKARVEALLDCGLACTLDAVQGLKGKEPRTWMAALGGACEPAHFGLEMYGTWILSPEWFLLHKVGGLAAPHIQATTGAGKKRMERAMAAFRLALPLPAVAPRLYELPVAPAEVSVPVATRTYVVLPASGPMRVGATPYATLDARGASMSAPEGQALFPGNEAASFDLKTLVLEAGGASAAPHPAAADAAPSAAAEPVEPAGGSGLPPGLHGEVKKTLRGDAGEKGEPVPLMLADGSRPAAEVVGIAAVLPGVLLAVASPEDSAARALAVELHGDLSGGGEAAGQARISLAPGSLDAARKAAGGPEETVVIRVEEGVPWSDAVAVVAVAIARGARRIALNSPRAEHGARTGWAGAEVGHGASGQGPPAISVITDEAPTVTGAGLNASFLRRLMRSRIPLLRSCYERELQRSAKLAGKVDLSFTIGPDGAVSSSKGTGLAKVSDCLAHQVKQMKFPKPKDGAAVSVRYPLVFKPKGE